MNIKLIVLSLFLLVSSLAFTGCATKEPPVVFKPQVVCFDFEKYQLSPKVSLELKLEEEELEVLNSRADELHQTIIFYEVQIDKYEKFCKKHKEI